MQEHAFTSIIRTILEQDFGDIAPILFEQSHLLIYLNIKTRSASKGSKSRSSFANHYAVYVLIEDYVKNGFAEGGNYTHYEGAKFTELFQRQRELPFGDKLQNHALNHRLNEEFKKYFPTTSQIPIIRNSQTNRYWINENLLIHHINGKKINIARSILKIIDAYISAKRDAFELFIANSVKIQSLANESPEKAFEFIQTLLVPQVDARIFEIVSYAILKAHYSKQIIYWGWHIDQIQADTLSLYKTGRTNANDGGIDFVMKPLGRFFKVTETTDVKKYFLDIDKIEKYPLTFVIKSQHPVAELQIQIEQQARKIYPIEQIIERYLNAIEEIINIPTLLQHLTACIKQGLLSQIIEEIILQSYIEFNMPLD